jgi:hypothetical protein
MFTDRHVHDTNPPATVAPSTAGRVRCTGKPYGVAHLGVGCAEAIGATATNMAAARLTPTSEAVPIRPPQNEAPARTGGDVE